MNVSMSADEDHQATGIDARFESELTEQIPGWTARSTLPRVEHRALEKRFVVTLEGHEAYVQYELDDQVIRLVSTFVPPELRQRRLAEHLVSAALEHAERRQLKVAPVCSYVVRFLSRHPEFGCVEIVQESNG